MGAPTWQSYAFSCKYVENCFPEQGFGGRQCPMEEGSQPPVLENMLTGSAYFIHISSCNFLGIFYALSCYWSQECGGLVFLLHVIILLIWKLEWEESHNTKIIMIHLVELLKEITLLLLFIIIVGKADAITIIFIDDRNSNFYVGYN